MLYGVLYFAPDFRTPIAHTVDQNILQVQFSLSAFIASVLRAKAVPPIQRQDRQLSECVQNSGLDPGDAARHISGALVRDTTRATPKSHARRTVSHYRRAVVARALALDSSRIVMWNIGVK